MNNFIRVELHNHTDESDGFLTVKELLNYLSENNIKYFSITDHNTISAYQHIKDLSNIIIGIELTTYYGHILCINYPRYINWENININDGSAFIEQVHSENGLIGLAHPFSVGSPLSNGMKLEIKFDLNKIDYIEIINNAHSMFPDNYKAIQYWEELFLNNFDIAPVTGLDLHKKTDYINKAYVTYLKNDKNKKISLLLNDAIKTQNIYIAKDIIIDYQIDDKLCINLIYLNNINDSLILSITTKQGEQYFTIKDTLLVNINDLMQKRLILKLYKEKVSYHNLLAITPVKL